MSDDGAQVTELPQMWQFIYPQFNKKQEEGEENDENDEENEDEEESVASNHKDTPNERPTDYIKLSKKAPRLGKLIRFLNEMEEDEELTTTLLERDPVTQQTLLQWAALNRHYMLVEYLVKRLQRGAFGFDPEAMEVAIYNRWEEMRPELPTAAEVAEKQRLKEQERAQRNAQRNGEEEDEEENEEENEPTPEDMVFEAVEEFHEQLGEGGVGTVKRIGELGVFIGARLRDGTKQGLGQSLFPNGDSYAGEYKENLRDGTGVYAWASMKGLLYCGQWLKNKRHGYGRMVYPDGSRYLGNWANDTKDGRGRYTYADGSSYDGMWVSNQKHGYGVHQFTDGSAYVGTFHNNDFVSGEWQLANGTTRYVGNFKKDVPVGSGVFIHRCGQKEGAYLEEGIFYKGKWQPGALKGSTKFIPQLELLAPRMQSRRAPLIFSEDCNGHTTTDLVRAANFGPLRRWVDALTPTSEDPRHGVELKGIEVCALGYDAEQSDRLVELRVRPIVVDAEGKRLRGQGEEIILLKEPEARLLTLLEPAAGSDAEPLVVLERALQFVSPDAEHLQHRLPAVEVTVDGAVGGEFVRAVGGALSLSLSRAENTVDLIQPLRSNPFYTNAQESVLLYAQQLHHDAIATIAEKLNGASADPALRSYVAVPLSQVMEVSTDAITVIAAGTVVQRRKVHKLPQSTAPPLRPPTPLAPRPQPRPELQPLYEAKGERDHEDEAE